MSTTPPTSPGLEQYSLAAPDSVSQALRGLEAAGSPLLRGVLPILPWIVLLMAVAALVADDPMYASGMIAVAVCLFAFQSLLQRLPKTLSTLWNRNIIAAKSPTTSRDKRPTEEVHSAKDAPSTPSVRGDQFATFIRNFRGLLNHQAQWEAGASLGLLGVSWRLLYMTQHGSFIFVKPYVDLSEKHFVDLIIGPMTLVAEYLIGFMLGLLAWRMLVIGIEVWRLGDRFDLIPQLRHPDRCGGFKPLGSLCLFNALIITVVHPSDLDTQGLGF